MKVSEKISFLGLFCFMTGVSLSSFIWGARSIPYYTAVGLAVVLSLPFMLSKAGKLGMSMVWISLVVITPVVLYFIHISLFEQFLNGDLVFFQYLAISCAIWLAVVTGMLSSSMFKRLMFWTCIVHILICVYGLHGHSTQMAVTGDERAITDDIAVSFWGEIAIGAIMAAVLSSSIVLIAISFVVGGLVIIETQLRGPGISVIVALVIYFSIKMWKSAKCGNVVKLGIVFSLIMGMLFIGLLFGHSLWSLISRVLMLDDANRGISSGLSGRVEGWVYGIKMFFDSPIVGSGFFDTEEKSIHCGYIRILAHFGVVFAIPMLYLLARSLFKSLKLDRPELIATIIGYSLFISTSPRYINFQIMPFVGLAAIAHVLLINKKDILGVRARHNGMPCREPGRSGAPHLVGVPPNQARGARPSSHVM
jgi:hypothetical protein